MSAAVSAPSQSDATPWTGLTGATAAFVTAAAARAAGRRRRLQSRVRLGWSPRHTPKYREKHHKHERTGPKLLKSGYWQQGKDDLDEDIFEWFGLQELFDEPPAAVTEMEELAAFSVMGDFVPRRYDAPEYRQPKRPLTLQKGFSAPYPVDQDEERSFVRDMQAALDFGKVQSYDELTRAHVVTSTECLRLLCAFADGTLIEDFRAKGRHTARNNEPVPQDLMRVIPLTEDASSIALACVWYWAPRAIVTGTGALNRRSYDPSMLRASTGQAATGFSGSPNSIREWNDPMHYRILKYKCAELNMVVRAPVAARVPSVDLDAMDVGQSVEVCSVNRRDVADLWGQDLPSKFAQMQLGDVGMVVRGVVDKGNLLDVQEITQDDLKLDRPKVVEESALILGRVASLLRKIREVAQCPGCLNKVLYIQYYDQELRVVTPRFMSDVEAEEEDPDYGPYGNQALVVLQGAAVQS